MSIVAIMKLGAAVVPVDIHHPHARQLTMFREAHIASVLVENTKETHKQICLEFPVFDLSAWRIAQETSGLPAKDRMGDSSRSQINLANFAKPEDDAFIAFTSGSTGTPKGIVQGHAAIITMSRALAAALDVNSSSRVAQIAPYVFDVAMMEFAMSFGTGAALCIMRRKELIFPEPGELAEHLTQSQVTHITLSPTMLKSISVGSIPSVRVLSVMGEALDRSAVELWASTPEKRFVQFWGCTEGTILQSVTPPIASHHEPQNIGFALEKACRLWVVDPDDANTLRKDGQAGELVIESRALASRYINQPEQTARAFLKQVSWTTAGPDTYFYRTGDLARKEPDGSVTFLGRQDGQMSLHGERVELGEIDYHIERLGLPKEADCFADFDAMSQTIVGFVCGHNQGLEIASSMPLTILPWRDAVITKSLLSEKMSQLLHDGNLASNMVPNWWVPVPRRPLTISHKTNRLELRQLLKQLSPGLWDEYRVVPE